MRKFLLGGMMFFGLAMPVMADTPLPCDDITTSDLGEYSDTMFKRASGGLIEVFDVIGDIIGPNSRNECIAHLMTNKGEIAWTFTRHSVNGNAYITSRSSIDWSDFLRTHPAYR